jgi:hypothetical protein
MQKAADVPMKPLPLPETCMSTNNCVVHLALFSYLVHRGFVFNLIRTRILDSSTMRPGSSTVS